MILGAVGLRSVLCRRRFASAGVLTLGDGFQVLWIHAVPNATEMINRETLLNWSGSPFVGKAMNSGRLLA